MAYSRKAVLGISAFYHDSAAALVVDGVIVAAAHEERFTRIKHDKAFPVESVKYVLKEYGVSINDLECIVFYDKPYIKLERLLETYLDFAPRGVKSFIVSMPVWFHEKIFARREIWKGLEQVHGGKIKHKPQLLFTEHHLSHGASAFYPSPFRDAAILTVDGVGEWATATIAHGQDTHISLKRELHFPHSVGLLYSAFTYYCGFQVNSGEYKLMGLAPYGEKGSEEVQKFKEKILDHLITLYDDGSIYMHIEYFNFATGLTMCHDKLWNELFGIPKRASESEITQSYMNLALAIQEVTEEIMLKLAKTAKKLTGEKYLVMAGGVALNCVANSKIVKAGIFEDVWVQPASGDAGGALGAALAAYYMQGYGPRYIQQGKDSMQGSLLGPEFDDEETIRVAHYYNAPYIHYETYDEVVQSAARILASGKIVGWVQGRMEWGPRALGNRSILGDPRDPMMQKNMNIKIKFREGFRPFAPSVCIEDTQEYFEWKGASPYMLFVAQVARHRQIKLGQSTGLYERLYQPRSDIPAVTHLDYSARLQTVAKEYNEKYWKLIQAFKEQTGCGVIVNTSFNVRGEPIVCTPKDAYRCFMASDMDYLVVGNILFDKKAQPTDRMEEFKKGPHALD